MTEPHPIGGRHAVYAGWILGLAIAQGLQVEPITAADGRYTDQFRIAVGPWSVDVTLVIPPPPDDWTLDP